ncbi:MAG: hypothetical protein U5R31_16110 [Acidimicrobiia bacterium]|nr:hypothetical protein [Acidimicrobiia bacterium]
MPAPESQLSAADVVARVTRELHPEVPDRRVGIELEWLSRVTGGGRRPTLAEAQTVVDDVGPLPRGAGSASSRVRSSS